MTPITRRIVQTCDQGSTTAQGGPVFKPAFFFFVAVLVSTPVGAQQFGISDAPATAPEDPGTNLSWELELAPAFGDNPEVSGFKALEDNAISGAVSLQHNFPSRTYVAATASAEASPEFAAPRVQGAEIGGEIKLGQSILLGSSADPEDNRDKLDIHAVAKLSHGTEEADNVRRSYTDRELGLEATLTNILWLYRDLNEADRSKWRPGPGYEFTAGWTDINSDRPDRDSRALTATGALAYETRGGLGLKGSVEYETVRYRRVALAGEHRVDETVTGYVGVDVTKLLPTQWSVLKSIEIGGEITHTDSNDDSEDDTGVYLRLKIGLGGTRSLPRRR